MRRGTLIGMVSRAAASPIALALMVTSCAGAQAGSSGSQGTASPRFVVPQEDGTSCTDTAAPAKQIKLSDRQLLRTGGHNDLNTVVFGRLKGRPIAISAGTEGSVRFWKLPSLQPAAEPMKGTRAGYVEVGGRPAVFTIGKYGGRLWDLGTRKKLLSVPGKVTAFASERSTLFTGDPEGRVKVWDLRTRTLVRQFAGVPAFSDAPPFAMAVVGSRLVAQHGDLRVLDPATGRHSGKALAHWDPETAEEVFSGPYFSPIGKVEIVGGATLIAEHYGALYSWDLATRKETGTFFEPEEKHSYSSFAASQDYVLAGENNDEDHDDTTAGSAVVVWDAHTKKRRILTGHAQAVTALAAGTLEGKPVALSGSRDNTIRLWDLDSGRELSRTEPAGPVREVTDLAVGEVDGRSVVVAAAADGVLRMWDLKSRALSGITSRFAADRDPTDKGAAGLRGLAITELDGIPVAVTALDGVKIVDLRTFREVGTLPGLGEFQLVRHGGRPAIVAREDREDRARFSTWDLSTKQLLGQLDLDLDTTGEGIELETLGDRPMALYRAGSRKNWDGRTLHVWDLTTRGELPPVDVSPMGLADGFTGAFVTRIGCDPVILSYYEKSGQVRFHNADTGRPMGGPVNLGGSPVLVGSVAGRSVAVVQNLSADGEDEGDSFIQLWDLATRKPLTPRIDTPEITTMTLGTLGDIPVLVAAGADEQVWYWRLGS